MTESRNEIIGLIILGIFVQLGPFFVVARRGTTPYDYVRQRTSKMLLFRIFAQNYEHKKPTGIGRLRYNGFHSILMSGGNNLLFQC